MSYDQSPRYPRSEAGVSVADLVSVLRTQQEKLGEPTTLDYNKVVNIIQEHSKNHLQTAFNLGVQINLLETKLEQHREKLRQAYAENP